MSGKPIALLRIFAYSLAALIILFAAGGCSDMLHRPDASETIVRTYEGVLSMMTKTALSSEGDVSWCMGDKITYYCKDGGQLGEFSIPADAVSARMSLILATDATYLISIYGASAVTDYSMNSLSLSDVVKAEQSGTFADGHVAIARTTTVDSPVLYFCNLVSFITFSTIREDVDHIILSSNDDTPLHANGIVSVNYSNDKPSVSFGPSKGSSIMVNLNGPGLYYIATLPNTLQNGFSLSCYDANDNLIATAIGNNPLVLNRTSIVRLGLIDNHFVGKNDIILNNYAPDINWDGNQNANAAILNQKYGEDYNWDSISNSGANIHKNGYNGDTNWDTTRNGNAGVGNNGYGEDSNWDKNGNAGANLGKNGYGNDKNWN